MKNPFAVLISAIVVFVALAFMFYGAMDEDDVAASWNEIISKCAQSDLLGGTSLFFGMSNNVGPGSVWRSTEQSGFNLRWLPEDLDGAVGKPPNFVQIGEVSNCVGNSTSVISFSPSALIETDMAPISGEIEATLNKANSIKVAVDGWSIDLLREGPFEKWAMTLDNAEQQDLGAGNRLVIVKAVKIAGISVDLFFEKEVSVDLQTKVSEEFASSSKLSASLATDWKSERNLQLKSSKPFYIFGELSRLDKQKGGRFPASETTPVGIQKEVIYIPENVNVGADNSSH